MLSAAARPQRRGDAAGAARSFEVARRCYPGNGTSHFNLATALAQLGDAAGAERSYREVLVEFLAG